MSNEHKEFMLKRIELYTLIELLISFYDDGVDFIDISGVREDHQDTIILIATNEKYDDDNDEDFSEDYIEDIEPMINRKLSEDDLNQLI